MAHTEQRNFIDKVKSKFPQYFINKSVLEFGSLNINGTVRDYFKDCEYIGIDVAVGNCVDIVSKAHEYRWNKVDVVISCEMLEHDPYWSLSIKNMLDHVKPGGLLIITCATTGRPEHGTFRTSPNDSPFTVDWDYYRNVTVGDVLDSFLDTPKKLFREHMFEVNENSFDLYFYGVKK